MQKQNKKQQSNKVGNRKAGSRTQLAFKPVRVRSDIAISPPQMKSRGQKFSKPSPTGAGFDMHFDAVSGPAKPDDRSEPFDELVATLIGQTAFTITSFSINPGNPTTFPWLSRIALLFERYQFEQLEFYFQHDVSQFNAQGAAGLVLLSALFDAASAPPTSKVQIEATFPRVICMPNQNALLRVPVSRLHPKGYPLFVRGSTLPGGADIKTYDAGNFFATVQGMAGAGEVGELHVRGRVRLIDRILDSSIVAAPANNQVVILQSSVGEAVTSTVNYTLLLAGPQIGSLGVVNTSGSLLFPAGNYVLDVDTTAVFSGLSTVTTMSVFQNGALLPATGLPAMDYTSGTLTTVPLHSSVFFSSTGAATSAITIVIKNTFSTGTSTAYGLVRVQAV